MSSVGASLEKLIVTRVRSEIENTFSDSKEKEDAHKLFSLALSVKGFRSYLFIIAVFGTFINGLLLSDLFLGCCGNKVSWPLAGGVIFFTLFITNWLIGKRAGRKREIKELLESDPEYWEPIRFKVSKICREAKRAIW